MKFHLCRIELLSSCRSTHTVQPVLESRSLFISSHLKRVPPPPSHCMHTPHILMIHPHTKDTLLIQPYRHYPSLHCTVLFCSALHRVDQSTSLTPHSPVILSPWYHITPGSVPISASPLWLVYWMTIRPSSQVRTMSSVRSHTAPYPLCAL
jgi:hypothetical protein